MFVGHERAGPASLFIFSGAFSPNRDRFPRNRGIQERKGRECRLTKRISPPFLRRTMRVESGGSHLLLS